MPFQRELIEQEGNLMPRRVRDGGPFFLYHCSACRRPSHVERNRAGFFLPTPPPIVPFAEAAWALFSTEQRMELDRKREYARRRAGRKGWFHGAYADELVREGSSRPLRATARRKPAAARPQPAEAPEPEPEAPESTEAPHDPPPEAKPDEDVESHYAVLGVEITADRDAVRRAYRELAKQYHPDKFAGLDASFQALAHEKFKRITAARDALLADLD